MCPYSCNITSTGLSTCSCRYRVHNCVRYRDRGRKPEIRPDSGIFSGLGLKPNSNPSFASFPLPRKSCSYHTRLQMPLLPFFHCVNSGTSSYLVRTLPGVVFIFGCDTHWPFLRLSPILTILYAAYLGFSSKELSTSTTFCTIELRLFPFLLLTIFEKVACKLLFRNLL